MFPLHICLKRTNFSVVTPCFVFLSQISKQLDTVFRGMTKMFYPSTGNNITYCIFCRFLFNSKVWVNLIKKIKLFIHICQSQHALYLFRVLCSRTVKNCSAHKRLCPLEEFQISIIKSNNQRKVICSRFLRCRNGSISIKKASQICPNIPFARQVVFENFSRIRSYLRSVVLKMHINLPFSISIAHICGNYNA